MQPEQQPPILIHAVVCRDRCLSHLRVLLPKLRRVQTEVVLVMVEVEGKWVDLKVMPELRFANNIFYMKKASSLVDIN